MELPTNKTKGLTGRTICACPLSWVECLGLLEWVRSLKGGQLLITKEDQCMLLQCLEGRLNAMRRTSINLRLAAGHTPEEIREATLHTTNGALYNYVGASSAAVHHPKPLRTPKM